MKSVGPALCSAFLKRNTQGYCHGLVFKIKFSKAVGKKNVSGEIKGGWKYLWLVEFMEKGESWKCITAFQMSRVGSWAAPWTGCMPVKWVNYLQRRSGECFKINLMEHAVGM